MRDARKFEEALVFAHRLHADQTRKGTQVPYVAHILGVASIALEYGADEEQAIAALLHDAVEDQGGRPVLEEIRKRFGDRVAEIVDGCTDSYKTPKPPWKDRKQDYLAKLPEEGDDTLLVSASDKLHNARAILRDCRMQGEAAWDRFRAGKSGVLWYYRSLARIFLSRGSHPLYQELERVVAELERVASSPEGGAGQGATG